MNSAVIATGTITIAVALMGALSYFMPQLTRRDIYFSVTVVPSFRDTSRARSVLRTYRIQIALATIALAAASALFGSAKPILTQVALYAQIAVSFAIFYQARRRTLPYAVDPTPVREAAVTGRPRIVPGGFLVSAGPLIIVAAVAAYVWMHAGDLPAQIPVHYNGDWQPDRWQTRTPEHLLLPLIGAFVPLAVMALVLYGLGHWVRAVHAAGAMGARELRFRRIVAMLILALSYVVAAQWTFVTLRLFFPTLRLAPGFGLVIASIPAFIVVAGLIVLARLGQGGARSPAVFGNAAVGDRIADRFWRLGIFYVNPEDPAIFVEKRFGLGYTVNFGRATAWLIILIPIVIAVSMVFALRHTT